MQCQARARGPCALAIHNAQTYDAADVQRFCMKRGGTTALVFNNNIYLAAFGRELRSGASLSEGFSARG